MRILAAVMLSTLMFGCSSDPDESDADASAPEPDAEPVDLCTLAPVGQVTLPDDDAKHQEPTEWWYWTGHLQAEDGRWFGFESAFFLQDSPIGGGRGQMVHFALTDPTAGVFAYDDQFSTAEPPAIAGGFDMAVGVHTATGGGGHDFLHGEAGDYRLDVELTELKRPVLQHGDGYTDYDFGGNTYYYSRERMAATGTLTIGEETLNVTGTGWFDHQWGELSTAIDTGWDWFAIQLDDDREIMLYIVRVEGAEVLVGGSYTAADCAVTEIGPTDFQVTPLGEWTSPHTGCTYPMGWTVTVPDLTLTVTPVMEDQELDTLIIDYWEGMAEVTGDATGRAYVELTGYCG